MTSWLQFAPRSINDREYWNSVRAKPHLKGFLERLDVSCESAPLVPPVPLATDFLAARRTGERRRTDNFWQREHRFLAELALRRCVRGLEPNDPDDKLANWLWMFLTMPTWSVAAHIPNQELPQAGVPVLDLASCEMAGEMAELRESLKPWMDSISKSLADSIIYEIDQRILTPYGNGIEVWWQSPKNDRMNNWCGVCAGSILIACESLAVQGHPRPKARARALEGLRIFFERAFTPGGECDEGVMYWNYGLMYACMALCRLSREEFEHTVDVRRFEQVIDYPRRAHLFGNCFFSGNDSGLFAGASVVFVPWLARVSSEWFNGWLKASSSDGIRAYSQVARLVHWPETPPTATLATDATTRLRILDDQQVAILRTPTPKGDIVACLSGGTNFERHNHNDLGHFILAFNEKLIVPDLGAPQYRTEFFSDKRYTFLSASSRGHCCPIINGIEQRDGKAAVGRVLKRDPFTLELSTAYPPEVQLKSWVRSLASREASVVISDRFESAAGQKIVHRLWSLEPIEKLGANEFSFGPLKCTLSKAPASAAIKTEDPNAHLLRDFTDRTLYMIDLEYEAGVNGVLEVETAFEPR